MRATFPAQDRADVGEATKTFERSMARPNSGLWGDLKYLPRWLLGRPNVVLHFDQQTMAKISRTIFGTDHGADRLTRRSTTGMVQRLGSHTIENTSNLQTPIGLNVAEAEFYAFVYGSCYAVGFQSYLRDLGINVDITIDSDSDAAQASASRQGQGKQRHVHQTRYLWTQQ